MLSPGIFCSLLLPRQAAETAREAYAGLTKNYTCCSYASRLIRSTLLESTSIPRHSEFLDRAAELLSCMPISLAREWIVRRAS